MSSLSHFAPQLFFLVYLHTNVGLPGPPATTLPTQSATLLLVSSQPQLPVSTPPAGLDECFLFNSLVVGLPYSSVFCQFWLFFVFKFVVVLLSVVRGSKALSTHLLLHPGWKSLIDSCIHTDRDDALTQLPVLGNGTFLVPSFQYFSL